jgi:hypothetical protein
VEVSYYSTINVFGTEAESQLKKRGEVPSTGGWTFLSSSQEGRIRLSSGLNHKRLKERATRYMEGRSNI